MSSDPATRQSLFGTAFRVGRLWGFIAFLVLITVIYALRSFFKKT